MEFSHLESDFLTSGSRPNIEVEDSPSSDYAPKNLLSAWSSTESVLWELNRHYLENCNSLCLKSQNCLGSLEKITPDACHLRRAVKL